MNREVDNAISTQLSPSDLYNTVSEQPDQIEELFSSASAFALEWISDKHGSAQEFVQAMEEEFGLKIRMYLLEIIEGILGVKILKPKLRQYLDTTLSNEELAEALGARPSSHEEEKSSLDELFRRSIRLHSSSKYAEAITFISKLPKYSPYNNLLVYFQNPQAAYWATAARWKNDFGRCLKEDCRPMLILAPMTPVLMVYDVTDTEGEPLPEWFNDLFKVEGGFNETVLNRTIKNCLSHDAIDVIEKKLGLTQGGSAIRLGRDKDVKIRIELKAALESKVHYAILCHELAHIYLGHLGGDEDKWWPSRLYLNRHHREIEAESVAYIVCRRIGLLSPSAEYLTGYIREPSDLSKVSIDMIAKVAGRIEGMGERILPKREPKAKA